MSDSANENEAIRFTIEANNLSLAAAVAGYVGAAETAKALESVIGEEAVRRIEWAMLNALDRMDATADQVAHMHREIREIFAR